MAFQVKLDGFSNGIEWLFKWNLMVFQMESDGFSNGI